MYADLALYIDGRFVSGEGRQGEPVLNPVDGRVLAELPHASAADLDDALAAAHRAFPAWKRTSPRDRARILSRAAATIRDRADAIARVLVMEQGKPFAEARVEVMTSAEIFDWCGEEARRAYGRIVPGADPSVRQMVLVEPVGPAAAFTPWNFPALTPARKIAGALAAGCTLILKASEETPGTAIELARALDAAGLPKGVLNLVFGPPATISERLIGAEEIRKISFTGSTAVGKQLVKLAAEGMKRTTMELGGSAPVVVFDDVDVDKTVATLVAGKFRNAGQVCVSPSRFFVHEAVYDRFVDGFTAATKALQVGDGLADGTKMGPLANPRRVEAMERIVADVESRGGQVRTGGARVGNQGFFFAPTVVTDLPDPGLLWCEETFGPVAPVAPFQSFDEVVERANRTPYGLAGYAFTQSARRAADIADAIETGMVGVNSLAISTPETPFGGIKESGHGQEGGVEGLHAYQNIKFVSQGG